MPQFDEIMNYDLLVIYDAKASESDLMEYDQGLASLMTEQMIPILYDGVTIASEIGDQNAELFAISIHQELSPFVELRNSQTQEKLELREEGDIVNEKITI